MIACAIIRNKICMFWRKNRYKVIEKPAKERTLYCHQMIANFANVLGLCRIWLTSPEFGTPPPLRCDAHRNRRWNSCCPVLVPLDSARCAYSVIQLLTRFLANVKILNLWNRNKESPGCFLYSTWYFFSVLMMMKLFGHFSHDTSISPQSLSKCSRKAT